MLDSNSTVACLITSLGSWNLDLINNVFSIDEAIIIQSLPIGGMSCPDLFTWKYTENGVYTVKSGYWEARKIGVGGFLGGPSNSHSLSWWRQP